MPPAKVALTCALTAAALSACGSINVKPVASSGSSAPASRGRIDDPRTTKTNHVKCLRKAHLPVSEVGNTRLQIGALPAGPTVVFEPSPGVAQGDQIQGIEQGAEVIGSALLYPNQASDGELKQIETCLAVGVSG